LRDIQITPIIEGNKYGEKADIFMYSDSTRILQIFRKLIRKALERAKKGSNMEIVVKKPYRLNKN